MLFSGLICESGYFQVVKVVLLEGESWAFGCQKWHFWSGFSVLFEGEIGFRKLKILIVNGLRKCSYFACRRPTFNLLPNIASIWRFVDFSGC